MGLNPKDLRINEQISLAYTYDYMEDKQRIEKKKFILYVIIIILG